MSALLDRLTENSTKKIYEFHQPIPIPSYLVAIAVGALVSKQVGPRSKVWAEKEFIDQSAYEFGEAETMLQIAEQLCGPYVWGKVQKIVLCIIFFINYNLSDSLIFIVFRIIYLCRHV